MCGMAQDGLAHVRHLTKELDQTREAMSTLVTAGEVNRMSFSPDHSNILNLPQFADSDVVLDQVNHLRAEIKQVVEAMDSTVLEESPTLGLKEAEAILQINNALEPLRVVLSGIARDGLEQIEQLEAVLQRSQRSVRSQSPAMDLSLIVDAAEAPHSELEAAWAEMRVLSADVVRLRGQLEGAVPSEKYAKLQTEVNSLRLELESARKEVEDTQRQLEKLEHQAKESKEEEMRLRCLAEEQRVQLAAISCLADANRAESLRLAKEMDKILVQMDGALPLQAADALRAELLRTRAELDRLRTAHALEAADADSRRAEAVRLRRQLESMVSREEMDALKDQVYANCLLITGSVHLCCDRKK